ncbi:hypothetical protein [Nocardia carnea]|uniref:hypothetical protein n=1 Tax=Nocardia carnea TaxID=37328 RepID=UPI00245474C2|nr:hypothetical protein [Nocardia carnea]
MADKYYVHTKDGEVPEERDAPPESGFYYSQDGAGNDVTLWEATPWGPRKIETFESGSKDFLLTADGDAYGRGISSGSYHIESDERKEGDDEHQLAETFGPEYKPTDSSGLRFQDKEDTDGDGNKSEYLYADYEKFPLTIETPSSDIGIGPSADLIDVITLANLQLRWLARQMGTGEIHKPEILLDPQGKEKHLDDNLDKEFATNLTAQGASSEAEADANFRMSELLREWEEIDGKFGTEVLTIDRHNHDAYKEVYDKVQDINEAMAFSLVGKFKYGSDDDSDTWQEEMTGAAEEGLTDVEKEKQESVNKDKPDDEKKDLTDVGIQHVVEETELLEIIRRGMEDCGKRVNLYAEQMEALADRNPEAKKLVDDGKWRQGFDPESEKPAEDGGGNDDDGGNNDDNGGGNNDDNGGNNNGGNNNGGNNNGGNNNGGNNNGGNNNGGSNDSEFDNAANPDADSAADTDEDPAADPNSELADLGDEFANVLGGSPEGKSGTEDLLGGGEEDKPSSLEDRVMEYINGDTGNPGGSVTPAVQQTPQPQATPDMSSLAMMPLLSGLSGQGGGLFGGGEKGGEKDKDDDEPRGREENRQVPGPPQQSPGMPVSTDPGVVTAQPAVAAPTDTGAPPIISTPGATVDWPIPGDPDTKIKVPQGVSDALTRQQGNPAIDAGTAYAGTPGEQTVEKPWQVVDVSALRTGDVITWENHSAVIVDNGSGPHYLENGQLVPLNQSNLDNPQYGKFQNYFHPTGLDSAGATNMQVPEAPTELPEPKITASQPPEPPPVQGPEET